MLGELGLDTVSEQVYRALLAEPSLDAGLLAERLGLSQSEVGDALDELADLALLRMSRIESGRWRPVSLERGIALLLQRQQEQLEARRKALQESHAAAEAAVRGTHLHRPGPSAGVEHLADLDEIQSRMESLAQTATGEMCSIVPGIMRAEALHAARPLDTELLARGVGQKMLCHEQIRNNPTALAYELDMVRLGAQIRTAPTLPQRLLIVDRATAVVPYDPTTTGRGAVLITVPGIVAALGELFDRLWADAAPLGQDQTMDPDTGLTAAERELLKILATGATDEAAAKRLGVSLRTVKRRMENLTRRLNAGSRFEAGLRAAQRGWL